MSHLSFINFHLFPLILITISGSLLPLKAQTPTFNCTYKTVLIWLLVSCDTVLGLSITFNTLLIPQYISRWINLLYVMSFFPKSDDPSFYKLRVGQCQGCVWAHLVDVHLSHTSHSQLLKQTQEPKERDIKPQDSTGTLHCKKFSWSVLYGRNITLPFSGRIYKDNCQNIHHAT